MTQELPSEDPSSTPHLEFGVSGHAPEAVQSLRRAMRRARFDDAERVGVQAELRATQIGRLELLQDALIPLLAQIPKSADIFDVGLMPGTTPRLFIDMIGFVEMGRDARMYRFLQDTRHARITLAASTDVETIVAAITDYVARRLLERDKALAADDMNSGGILPLAAERGPTAAALADPGSKKRPILQWASSAFAFVIDLLGAIAFFTILAVAGWLIWSHMQGPG